MFMYLCIPGTESGTEQIVTRGAVNRLLSDKHDHTAALYYTNNKYNKFLVSVTQAIFKRIGISRYCWSLGILIETTMRTYIRTVFVISCPCIAI